MADLSISLAAVAAQARATNQLVADVQAIAADGFANPVTRAMALQLQAALATAFSDLRVKIQHRSTAA